MAYLGPADLFRVPGTDPSAEETPQRRERYHQRQPLGNAIATPNLKILAFVYEPHWLRLAVREEEIIHSSAELC